MNFVPSKKQSLQSRWKALLLYSGPDFELQEERLQVDKKPRIKHPPNVAAVRF
jgi:hypothetical protein